MERINLETAERQQFIDVTQLVYQRVKKYKINSGLCVIFCPHTTAAVTINENADCDVVSDIGNYLNKAVPWNNNYSHREGNSAAHIKSSFFGCSLTVIVNNAELVLGTWQGIYFCEFDGPRSRYLDIEVIGNK